MITSNIWTRSNPFSSPKRTEAKLRGLKGHSLDGDRRWNLFQQNDLDGSPGRWPVTFVDVDHHFVGFVGFEEHQSAPFEVASSQVDPSRPGSEAASLSNTGRCPEIRYLTLGSFNVFVRAVSHMHLFSGHKCAVSYVATRSLPRKRLRERAGFRYLDAMEVHRTVR